MRDLVFPIVVAVEPWFLNLNERYQDSLKQRVLSPVPRVSDSLCLGEAPELALPTGSQVLRWHD